MTYTSPNRGIDKKCKECGKSPSETEFGKHKYTLKHGGFSYHEKSTCKACEAKIAREYMAKNKDKRAEAKKKHRDKYYGTIKHHVQEKIATWRKVSNVPSNLTVEYLIELYEKQDGYCFYSGEKMIFGWVDGKVHHNSLSLDKLDPAKGYVKDNVVWCTYLINTMKQNLTEGQFYDAINRIYSTTYGIPMSNTSLRDKLNTIVLNSKVGDALPKVIEKETIEAAEQGKTSCRIYFSNDSGTKPFYAALGPVNVKAWKELTHPEFRFGPQIAGRDYDQLVIDFTKNAVADLAKTTGLDITLLPWPVPVNGGPTINIENSSAYRYNAVVIDLSWEKK